MKLLVVWENSVEQEVAEIIARMAPDLLAGIVAATVARLNIHRVPITARALSFRDLFSPGSSMPDEVAAYVAALERAVFVE